MAITFIIYDSLTVDRSSELREIAMAHSKAAVESATPETIRGTPTFGNSGGLSLMKWMANLEERVQATEETLHKHEEQLEITGHVCYGIRNRFIDNYKRKVLADPDIELQAKIDYGNKIAHESDVIADSLLYKLHKRTDVDVFYSLYQVSVEIALMLDRHRDRDVIAILNHMAYLRAQKTPISTVIQGVFHTLIDVLDNSTSDLGRSRGSLRDACERYYEVVGIH